MSEQGRETLHGQEDVRDERVIGLDHLVSEFAFGRMTHVETELSDHPGSYRHFLKEQVYAALEANGPADLDPVALRERIRAILKSIQLGAAAPAPAP